MGERRLALGIDLGGTTIKVGVVDDTGEILGRSEVATEAALGCEAVIASMARAGRAAMEAAGVAPEALAGAGIGIPGPCVADRVVEAVNLGWRDVPVAALLERELGLPVRLENDANCAALGEQWCGVAAGRQHVLMFTVGTGVGGGLILGGAIYRGHAGWAGEFGHIPVVEDGPPCNCGRRGCLETVASATAIAAAAQRAIAEGRAPRLAELSRLSGKADARVVIGAAREGDEVARQILHQAGTYLGLAAAALVSALNPELVVIGGGGSHAGEFLLDPIRQVIAARAMPGPAAAVQVVRATLGNDAGLIGAASLVWRK